MVVPDANVLIYAYSAEAIHHETSRRWLERALAGPEQVGFAWGVLLTFLRITTSAAMMRVPLRIEEAATAIDQWLQREVSTTLEPGPRHWQILGETLLESQSKGNLVNDAHLAALAIENGAAICSYDRDFRRFSRLRLIIPQGE